MIHVPEQITPCISGVEHTLSGAWRESVIPNAGRDGEGDGNEVISMLLCITAALLVVWGLGK